MSISRSKATFQLSEKDFVDAVNLANRPKNQKVYPVMVITFLIFAAYIAYTEPGEIFSLANAPLGIFFILSVFSGKVFCSHIARKEYRSRKDLQSERTIELLDEGIRVTALDSFTLTRWENIIKWIESDKAILVFGSRCCFHPIPKAISANGFDIQSLTDHLRTRIGPPVKLWGGRRYPQ